MVAPARAPVRTDRLRTLNAPRLVTVELDGDGMPDKLWRSNDNGGGRDGQEEGAAVVEEILETWRIDDEWWRRLISRRYYAVMLAGGTRVVLFEDLVTREWFMQMP